MMIDFKDDKKASQSLLILMPPIQTLQLRHAFAAKITIYLPV